MAWVTVHLTFSSGDAQLIRSRLESAGLLVNIVGELSALSMEGYALATGGIQVQVPADQAEEARALLAAPSPPTS